MKIKILILLLILSSRFSYAGDDFITLCKNKKSEKHVKLLSYNDIPQDLSPGLLAGGTICLIMAAVLTDQQNMSSPVGTTYKSIPNSSMWLIGVGGGMVLGGFILRIDF